MGDRPNILLVLTDQQNASMLSCAGNRYVRTPAMDKIAAAGTRFERAYCMNPMCVPSRFSLFTGRRGSNISLLNNKDEHISDIPAAILKNAMGWQMRRAGYHTAYGGKTHFPVGMTPEDFGFETISQDDRDLLAEDCAHFLARDHSEPFLLVASFINPHDICHLAIRDFAETPLERRLSRPDRIELLELDKALQIPEGIAEEEFFRRVCPPLPENFAIPTDEAGAIRLMQARSPFKRKARERYSETDWRMHRWAYARLTERVDGQIGRVLAALQDSQLADNTVVVFTSDHGDMDASHRMEHKTAFYEEAARVPLLITGPGMAKGAVNDQDQVSNGLDLLPTFCAIAGLEPTAELEGRSLLPLLNAARPAVWRDALPVESELGQMIVRQDAKYMRYYQGERREQLIDLAADPGETRNAIADDGQAKRLAELRAAFERLFPRSHDPYALRGGEYTGMK
ncbi:MAG: sulfatase-like hydrolase/transferase [Anaerolineae bacterium]|nr:sulfatase-like hydrolase/transferase [Anaerolineae bacterium]